MSSRHGDPPRGAPASTAQPPLSAPPSSGAPPPAEPAEATALPALPVLPAGRRRVPLLLLLLLHVPLGQPSPGAQRPGSSSTSPSQSSSSALHTSGLGSPGVHDPGVRARFARAHPDAAHLAHALVDPAIAVVVGGLHVSVASGWTSGDLSLQSLELGAYPSGGTSP